MSLPAVVRHLTQRTATELGLHDRGRIAPGLKADINIIDYDRLGLGVLKVVHDLPAEGRRIRQDVAGFEATIVSGEITYRNGRPTGKLPGRLIRSNTLAASAFCLLLYDPYLIMSVGFQLSYLAVVGIVYLQRPIYDLWEARSAVLDWAWQITFANFPPAFADLRMRPLWPKKLCGR